MTESPLKLDELQLAHENEWVALDAVHKELLGSSPTLDDLLASLSEEEKVAEPILFKVPSSDITLSPLGY